MRTILTILALIGLQFTTGCNLPTVFDAPIDWAYHPPQPIEEPSDTICTPIEYTDPAFVQGWWYIPNYPIDSVQVCVYPHCVTVAFNPSVIVVLDSLLSEKYPAYSYEVFTDFPETFVFIAKGTNDKALFNGKVWIRPTQFASGWGFDCNPQSFFFFDALSPEQWLDKIDQYPSFDRFTLQYTHWDSLEYIKAFDKILECRIGRKYADLRYLPFTFPDSVYDKFDVAGWEQVLH